MQRNFKTIRLIIFGILGILSACSSPESPEEVFSKTKDKLFQAESVGYSQVLFWENPSLGDIDTFRYESVFEPNSEAFFGYDFYGKKDNSEFWYLNQLALSVSHSDSLVMVLEQDPDRIRYNSYRSLGPIGLLGMDKWEYVKDSSVEGRILKNYRWTEMDTLIDGKYVLLENHLFLNPANYLPEYYSRRLYHDGKRNQIIDSYYRDYEFSTQKRLIEAKIPEGYVSKMMGEYKDVSSDLIQVGEQAPDFRLKDLDGNWVQLSGLRGKKVLLDFSMINCGWCRIALEKFNQPDFQFSENIIPLYINPVDSDDKKEKYLSRNPVPFQVLWNAQEIGEKYGVNAYPTFVLIDEDGKVEEVSLGFKDETIAAWKK